jgi:hypothetical protein
MEGFHTRLELLDGRLFYVHQLDVSGTGGSGSAIIVHHKCGYDGRTHGRGVTSQRLVLLDLSVFFYLAFEYPLLSCAS